MPVLLDHYDFPILCNRHHSYPGRKLIHIIGVNDLPLRAFTNIFAHFEPAVVEEIFGGEDFPFHERGILVIGYWACPP
jgi:hypothetical protein